MTNLSFKLPTSLIYSILTIIPILFFSYNTYNSNSHIEFNFIENFQILTLLLIIVLCFIGYKKTPENINKLFLPLGILFVFFIGRELNWGRVVYLWINEDMSREELSALRHAPVIKSMKALGLILGLYALYYTIKHNVYNAVIHLAKTARIYFFDGAFLFATIIGVLYTEKKLKNDFIEESLEAFLYVLVFFILKSYVFNKKNILNLK